MDIKSLFPKSLKYNQCQLYGLIVLRILIGWHFLYEGISKITNPYWSSAAFLMESKWIFSGWAQTIISDPALVTAVDFFEYVGIDSYRSWTYLWVFCQMGQHCRYGFIGPLLYGKSTIYWSELCCAY